MKSLPLGLLSFVFYQLWYSCQGFAYHQHSQGSFEFVGNENFEFAASFSAFQISITQK